MAAILVVACAVSLISCAVFSETTLIKSELLSLNVDSSGHKVCSTDRHSEEQFVATNSECAFACVAEIECIHYSYLTTKSLCQLFYYHPKSMAKVDGCTSYTNRPTISNVLDLQ